MSGEHARLNKAPGYCRLSRLPRQKIGRLSVVSNQRCDLARTSACTALRSPLIPVSRRSFARAALIFNGRLFLFVVSACWRAAAAAARVILGKTKCCAPAVAAHRSRAHVAPGDSAGAVYARHLSLVFLIRPAYLAAEAVVAAAWIGRAAAASSEVTSPQQVRALADPVTCRAFFFFR